MSSIKKTDDRGGGLWYNDSEGCDCSFSMAGKVLWVLREYLMKGGNLMKTRKKGTQIFFGIIFAVAVWALGFLLSGMVCFDEIIELYPAGVLVLLFPLLFVGACIFASKYALKNRSKAFYASAIAAFLFPAVMAAVCLFYDLLAGCLSNSALLAAINVLFLGVSFLSTPVLSVFLRLLSLGSESHTGDIIAAFCAVVMLSGLIASVVIYKKGNSRKKAEGS